MTESRSQSSSTPPGALELKLDAILPSTDEPKSFLLLLSGEHRGRLYAVDRADCIVGRSRSAAIRLDEKGVSQKHARISASGNGHTIEDLGSTNGTLLNGQLLEGCLELRSGDELQFGEAVLSYLSTAGDSDRTVPLGRVAESIRRSGRGLPPISVSAVPLSPLAPWGNSPPGEESLEARLIRIKLILGHVRRYWKLGFILAALGGLGGVGLTYWRPPPAEAVFEIQLTPAPSENPVERAGGQERYVFFRSAERNFTSAELVRKTLSSMGETDLSPGHVRAIQLSLEFSRVGEATYHGSYKHKNAEHAVRFLERHVTEYIDNEVGKALRVVKAEVDFLKKRVEEQNDELLRTEDVLKRFKQEHLSSLPEFVAGKLESRADVEVQRLAAEADLARARENRKAASQRLKRESPLIEQKVSAAQPYEQGLVDVRKRLSEAKASGLGDAHPQVRNLKREERDLQQRAQTVVESRVTDVERRANPKFTALKDEVGEWSAATRAAEESLGAINSHLQKLDKAVAELPEVEAQYARLTRSYESLQVLHRRMFERLRASELQLELEREAAKSHYDLIEPPHSSGVHLRQALIKRSAKGAIVGLVLAAILATFIELRRLFRSVGTSTPKQHAGAKFPGGNAIQALPPAR